MTQDERYYINSIITSIETILSDEGTVIDPNLKKELKTALKRFEKHELIKNYKAQERILYAQKKYELYNELKTLRENIESDSEV